MRSTGISTRSDRHQHARSRLHLPEMPPWQPKLSRHVDTEEGPQQELVKGIVRGKVVVKVVPHERAIHVFDLPVRCQIGDVIHVPAALREFVLLVHVGINPVDLGF